MRIHKHEFMNLLQDNECILLAMIPYATKHFFEDEEVIAPYRKYIEERSNQEWYRGKIKGENFMTYGNGMDFHNGKDCFFLSFLGYCEKNFYKYDNILVYEERHQANEVFFSYHIFAIR